MVSARESGSCRCEFAICLWELTTRCLYNLFLKCDSSLGTEVLDEITTGKLLYHFEFINASPRILPRVGFLLTDVWTASVTFTANKLISPRVKPAITGRDHRHLFVWSNLSICHSHWNDTDSGSLTLNSIVLFSLHDDQRVIRFPLTRVDCSSLEKSKQSFDCGSFTMTWMMPFKWIPETKVTYGRHHKWLSSHFYSFRAITRTLSIMTHRLVAKSVLRDKTTFGWNVCRQFIGFWCKAVADIVLKITVIDILDNMSRKVSLVFFKILTLLRCKTSNCVFATGITNYSLICLLSNTSQSQAFSCSFSFLSACLAALLLDLSFSELFSSNSNCSSSSTPFLVSSTNHPFLIASGESGKSVLQ